MEIEFQPPPAEGSVDALRLRFEAATMQLAADFGRVLDHITAHPRYNEKVEPAKRLLELLEAAHAQASTYLDDVENVDRGVQHIVEIMEAAANATQILADEHQVKPGSIADPAPVPSAFSALDTARKILRTGPVEVTVGENPLEDSPEG
jgi:hypothetical protein